MHSRARDCQWLALAVLACYASAIGGVFQFDDYNVIVNNAAVHSWERWAGTAGQSIRPLLKLSYTLNWSGEGAPLAFVVFNITVHLVNSLLVYALCVRWLQGRGPAGVHIALFAALLFALHPANTEAVTYICGRSSSFMALFYLGAMLAYATGRGTASNRDINDNRWLLWLATPLCFVLALGVKETAITLPAALLLWEHLSGGSWRRALARQWPVWLVAALATGYFLMQPNYVAHLQRSVEINSLQGNLATQSLAWVYLLQQWALQLSPNIDPDLVLQRDFSAVWPHLLVLIASVLFVMWSWRRHPAVAFALAWALLHLVPVYIFFPRLDVANDRQLYLAGWPLGLAVMAEGHALLQWFSRFAVAIRAAGIALGLALLLVLGGSTIQRNLQYHSEIALWEQTVQVSPGKARVYNNLGYAYMLAGRLEDAKREYRIALRINPEHVKARMNLARLEDSR